MRVLIRDVFAPQHLRCEVSGEHPVGPARAIKDKYEGVDFEPVVMDIYTGWNVAGVGPPVEGLQVSEEGDILRDAFESLVPLGTHTGNNFDIQCYPAGTTAIVSASIASFAIFGSADPSTTSTCAVDSATVDVRDVPAFHVPDFPDSRVLVLRFNYAIQNCRINRIAYQVTVFAPLGEKFHVVQVPANTIFEV